MKKVSKVAILGFISLGVDVATVAFEPARPHPSATRTPAKRLIPLHWLGARRDTTETETQRSWKVSEQKGPLAPDLDEAAFLDSMSHDLDSVKDLVDEHDALDEPGASPQIPFKKLDEAAARIPHASQDIYTRAASRCHEIARKSVEETILAREASMEKEPVEPRHFGGNALNGFAFLSVAVAAAGMAVTNSAFDPSQISLPVVDFSDVQAIDLSRADLSFPSFNLPSLDGSAFLSDGIETLYEGTKKALSVITSNVGIAADAAQAEMTKAQYHAADVLAGASGHVEALTAQATKFASAMPSQLEAVEEAAARTVADLMSTLQKEAVNVKDILPAQIDAAQAAAQSVQDSFVSQAREIASSAKTALDAAGSALVRPTPAPDFVVEIPDFRTIIARADQAENVRIAHFEQWLASTKTSLSDAVHALMRAEEARGDALLSQASSAWEASAAVQVENPPAMAVVEQPLLPTVPPTSGNIVSTPTVVLPDWIDEDTVKLARTALRL